MLSTYADSRGEAAPTSDDDAVSSERDRITREFYYLNLLSVFGKQLPIDQIDRMSIAASENRKLERFVFERRLASMLDQFRSSRCSGAVPAVPGTALTGWDAESLTLISTLRSHGHGLLLGLFHFGAHRQVLLDLASLGVPLSAPIAGRAYWDIYALREQAPPEFAGCLKLLEVEKRSVGRELLVDLRRGRVGALYVDGNMGPDGSFVEDGAVEVQFLGRQVRVKAGIARLSRALGAPILPLFATTSGDVANPRIVLGEPIFPEPYASEDSQSVSSGLESTMSLLYSQLEQQVCGAPTSWEYAFCLHRWTNQAVCQDELDQAAWRGAIARFDTGSPARINVHRVARVSFGGQPTWVDVESQRTYRLPAWFASWADMLQTGGGLSAETLRENQFSGTNDSGAVELLYELVRKQLVIVQGAAQVHRAPARDSR